MSAPATAIFASIPLLPDVFSVSGAISTMAGLGFATIPTLVIVSTPYPILCRIGVSDRDAHYGEVRVAERTAV